MSAKDSAPKFGIPASFEKLRVAQLSRGTLYEDPDFPATDASVFRKQRPPCYPFQWMRPHDISPTPHLYVDSTCRFDLKQGKLGNCWVVASLASISDHRTMVDRIVPKGQSFQPGWYAGMFVFRFWFFGKWTEVIIDDRLPVHKGELIFIHSHQPDEFWSALAEKAYAKLVGHYEALKSGLIGDALDDFTSGLTESMSLDRPIKIPNLVTILLKSFERESLVGAGIKAKAGGKRMLTGNIQDNGLVSGHAYTISDIRKLRIADERGAQRSLILIRVRNPWGSGVEWKGAWSDSSPEWQVISEKDRQAIGLVTADDGEFWMDWEDFLDNFDSLDICHLPPSLSLLSAKRWKCVQYNGSWSRGSTAGGRPFCRETHWKNPQYKVKLRDSDEDDNDTCTMLVGLMQEDMRRTSNKQVFNIGFAIYKASSQYTVPYPKEYFVNNRYVATCPYFTNARENVGRYELDPGEYIIVPCTYDKGEESRYLLRIYFENAGSEESDTEEQNKGADTSESNGTAGPRGQPSSTAPSTTSETMPNGISSSPEDQSPSGALKRLFTETAGTQFAVDAYQLATILNRSEPIFRKWPLTADAAKSLVSMADCDESFRVEWKECEYIVHYVRAWTRNFVALDTAGEGNVSSLTLREGIAGMGYRVPDSLIRRFMHRFSNTNNRINLSSFISCMAFIVKVMDIFKQTSKKGIARLSLDDFFRVGLVI